MTDSVIRTLLSEMDGVAAAVEKLDAAYRQDHNERGHLPYLDAANKALEKAAITSRNALELTRPRSESPANGGVTAPHIELSGVVEVVQYGWLHIKLNALLPHCRFQTPKYLSDTVTRLLDGYAASKYKLPFYDRAMLIIDEHCDIESRKVFDQDNKGWKAIPNALKGRVFPDDDQFTLGISLVSAKSEKTACHIFVINALEAGEFFNMRSSGVLYW